MAGRGQKVPLDGLVRLNFGRQSGQVERGEQFVDRWRDRTEEEVKGGCHCWRGRDRAIWGFNETRFLEPLLGVGCRGRPRAVAYR